MTPARWFALIAILLVGGGMYVYVQNNRVNQAVVITPTTQATSTDQQPLPQSGPSLSAFEYTPYKNQTIIAGSNNVELGAFRFVTGPREGVTMHNIVVTLTSPNSVSNLMLEMTTDEQNLSHASTNQIGATIASPSTSNSFSLNTDIPASSSFTIYIYCNVLSSTATGTAITTGIGAGTTGTGDKDGISVSANTAILQTVTVGQPYILQSFTVTSPSGGEQWQEGTTHTITWNQTVAEEVDIELTNKQPPVQNTINNQVFGKAGINTYSWTIPANNGYQPPSNGYRVEIIGPLYSNTGDFIKNMRSDSDTFTISAAN